ncbi:glycoside hydrolase family 3 N-terminal domain-containing protein [Fonticella tunisiensis]|uniref:beta-glucosidase n=1 Tax=Fonticella tunisiensis TaxID=1096341 RepID=A0A4R7KBQ6_9CLOT|nr:glycoside hydrolase family 3 N-terminal domain-containing protein [Fonticella tunisiensis]TDT51978.1 beta-glucosidase-like glycosyl hydrolase [Fonticella tunisiensis]
MYQKTKRGLSVVLIMIFVFSMLITRPLAQTARAEEADKPLYKDPTAPVEDRVKDLLSRMTLEEKIGQMMQGEIGTGNGNVKPQDVIDYSIGSVLSGGGADPVTGNDMQSWYDTVTALVEASTHNRLGIPLIYGVDAVHGHSNVIGATIFPHNIGLGAIGMGDLNAATDIVKRIGAATAEEMRVTNIPWTFAPCLANPQNPSWGRTYEGFGEDLDLVAALGTAYVKGLQGDTIDELKNPNKAAATVKHYLGEGYTDNGINQGNVSTMTKEEVAQKLIKPYADAIAEGVRTIMPSYNSIQGVKMHASKYLLTDVLKGQLGFDGFIITDYYAIQQITRDEAGNPVSGLKDQLRVAINAGNDMLMQPENWKTCISLIKQLVEEDIANPGTGIPMSRIDDAVSRILRVKFQLGLFENPITPNPANNPEVAAKLGSPEHRALAREAVSKSLVLLKNDEVNGKPILSQLKDMRKIFVAGKSANDIGNQSGGWTIHWQGQSGPITKGTTILEGIQKAVSEDQTVTFSADGTGAEGHDVAIVVVGEKPYAEGNGDNLNGLGFDATDKATLERVKAAGIPTVVVLVSGRPMIVTDYIKDWAGLVAAWLPGTEGEGVSDVLFGDKDFVGRLSMKWPFYIEAYPLTDANKQYVLFDKGYGLTKNQVTPKLPEKPTHPYDVIPEGAVPTALPGKVEAENYLYQVGWNPLGNEFIENTADVGGGKDVGWMNPGRYLKYYIDVPQTGTYKVNFRIASPNGQANAFSLRDMNGNITYVDAPKTGGWQSWRTVSTEVELNAGKQVVTFYSENGGFNLNWISFNLTESSAPAVTLTVDNTTLERTRTAKASVTARYSNGKDADLSGATIEYFSSNPEIVSVAEDGTITARKVGSAEVSAVVTLDGVVVETNTVPITVEELKAEPTVVVVESPRSIVEVGEVTTVDIRAKDAVDLYGFDLGFKYDAKLFEFVKVDVNKDFNLGNDGLEIGEDGSIRLIGTLKGEDEGAKGDVTLATLSFKAKDVHAAELFLLSQGSMLADSKSGSYTIPVDITKRVAIATSDLTNNGKTEVNDLVMVARAFGKIEGDEGYEASLDMNLDKKIDISDLAFIALRMRNK